MTDDNATALLDMTVGIVANYVANNTIAPDGIAALIGSTYAALLATGAPTAVEAEPVEQPTTAQIRRSVSEKGITSFLDGKTYQSLKRHLGANGYTPQSYREMFGLPSDYPTVSPTYAARRSELAKASGLGQGGRKPRAATKAAPKKRGS